MADDLVESAMAPIRAWLDESSSLAALPPDATTPVFVIMDESIHAPGAEGSSAPAEPEDTQSPRLVIAAWDQLAMVPWTLASRSRRIESLVADDVVETISSIETQRELPLGLDLLPVPKEGARSIFPIPRNSQSRAHGAASPNSDLPSLPGVGELISTHIAPVGKDNASTRAALRLNVNTTPRALLEAAAESAQVSLPDALWTSRGKNKPYRQAVPGGASAELGGTIAFTSSSDCWSFRIDAFVGVARSSWWVVLRRGERGWEIAQRIPIVTEPRE
ncbi:MAG: hypothetical protein FJ253_12180 [Phycisphaerae bacterium]|nr:hypothetical protein [Phycisphaerae bacterium]